MPDPKPDGPHRSESDAIVREAYELVLNREVDSEGLDYFSELLSTGLLRTTELYGALVGSREFIDHLPKGDLLPSPLSAAALEAVMALAMTAIRGDTSLPPAPGVDCDEAAYRTMLSNRRILSALECMVGQRARAFDDAGVLRLGRALGEWSCMHHPGGFSSTVAEIALGRSGRRLTAQIEPWSPSGDGRRVLHVMTVATEIGGHTPLAARWMRFQPSREHAVVLTEQNGSAVPESLVEAASAGVTVLSSPTPLERVVELSRRVQEADLVVLYIHPWDAVAVAALSNPTRRPPTLLVDFSDHMFWIGVGVADAVASLRPSGHDLVVHRRGVPAARALTVPLPLDPIVRTRSRAEAKAELGIDSESPVLLSVASAHKFADVGSESFTSVVARVLERAERATLVVVGPDGAARQWVDLLTRFPGRVATHGPTPHLAVFREAADVYLDSFPFGSPTSLFEAALFGTPAVCMRPPWASVLATEDADVRLLDAATSDEWVDLVLALVRDPDMREREGRRLAGEVLDAHGAPRLEARLDGLADAVERGAAGVGEAIPGAATLLDMALVGYQEASGIGRSFEDILFEGALAPERE